MKADSRPPSHRPEGSLVVLSPEEVARYSILAERARNDAFFGALWRFFRERAHSPLKGTHSAGTRTALPAE
jgi:hypothetical protein